MSSDVARPWSPDPLATSTMRSRSHTAPKRKPAFTSTLSAKKKARVCAAR
jgi:hypothetical protein